jgi:L-ascorbate metabolism protein UlaG (beta-lactamase superfamily)
MKLTYYGHACFAVDVAGKTVLFDPFITPNELARGLDIDRLAADYILVSHGHEDHVADLRAIALRTGATVLCNFEIYRWLAQQGVQSVLPMNHGGTARLDFGRAKLVAAIHSSSLPDGSYGGNPGGWVVETPEGNFYYSGDTALSQEMKLLGESTPLKFAVLCLGDTFTMGLDDAVRAADFIRCNQIVGVHYDTFPPIVIDHPAALAKFRQAGKTLHLVPIGQSVTF